MKLAGIIPRTLSVAFLTVPFLSYGATAIPIEKALADCNAAGIQLSSSAQPIQSDLKKETSLIGMAYLNYIYQNDITNPHFCESMLLMNSQVPSGTKNPYSQLFDLKMAKKTIKILQDIQLCFDYSIARTNPPLDKVQASVDIIKSALKS